VKSSIELINTSLFCKKIGVMEFRDIPTSAIACLAAFLKLSGVNIALDSLFDIAPISKDKVTENLLFSIGKRTGVRIEKVTIDEIQKVLVTTPVLLRRASDYSILLLEIDGDAFIAGLPGYSESFARIPFDSDILDGVKEVFALSASKIRPSLKNSFRAAKLWLLPWRVEYEAQYDAAIVAKYNASLSIRREMEKMPISLNKIAVEDLMKSHLSICPEFPVHYGCFRRINLKRGHTVFVDFKSVKLATRELLMYLDNKNPPCIDGAISIIARFFTDFQTIHPFANANRRMATLVITKYLERWSANIRWENISSPQYYYWTRCARQGHFKFLEEGFRSNLKFNLAVADLVPVNIAIKAP
jgi:hypothetical protein